MKSDIQTTVTGGGYGKEARSMAAKPPVLLLVGAWLVLVAGGIGGTVWYTGKLKSDITADVQAQADRQIAAVQPYIT